MDKGKTIYLSKTNVVIAPIWSLCSVSAGKLARSMRHLSIKSPKSPKPSQPMLPCSAYCQNPLKDSSTEWVGMRKRKGKGIYSEELLPVRWLGVLSLHPPFPVDVRRCTKLFFRWRKGTKAGNIFSVPEQRKGNSLLCLPILSQGVGTWWIIVAQDRSTVMTCVVVPSFLNLPASCSIYSFADVLTTKPLIRSAIFISWGHCCLVSLSLSHTTARQNYCEKWTFDLDLEALQRAKKEEKGWELSADHKDTSRSFTCHH